MERVFEVNARVHWTGTKQCGRSITYTTMQGKVFKLTDDPDIVVVKMRNGRKIRIHVSRLRFENERSELTDALMPPEVAKEAKNDAEQ